MPEHAATLRSATIEDDEALAELINYAGEGLPLYLWTKMAGAGGDPWAVGRARARREEGSFSYRNATVLDVGGRAVACLIGYLLPAEPPAIDSSMPAMFVPLQELENMAAATWYVNVLACQPQWRGSGFGAALLAHAARLATMDRAHGLSIIVADNNACAREWYERTGFRLVAERRMVKEAWQSPGSAWLLLVKDGVE